MKKLFLVVKNHMKFWLSILLWTPFLLWWVFATDCMEWEDLTRCIFQQAFNADTVMDMWKDVKTVWSEVLWGWLEVNVDFNSNTDAIQAKQSIVVKVTKFLLSIVIAISVTMILWNWIKYIIETGNWKESKSLVPNLIYIMVWIILALFSVTIITILQSIPNSLEEDLWKTETDQVFQSDSK